MKTKDKDFDVVTGDAAEPAVMAVAAEAAADAVEPIASFGEQAEQAVWSWFNENFRGSPVSRATEAWNHMQLVLPRLIADLKAL